MFTRPGDPGLVDGEPTGRSPAAGAPYRTWFSHPLRAAVMRGAIRELTAA